MSSPSPTPSPTTSKRTKKRPSNLNVPTPQNPQQVYRPLYDTPLYSPNSYYPPPQNMPPPYMNQYGYMSYGAYSSTYQTQPSNNQTQTQTQTQTQIDFDPFDFVPETQFQEGGNAPRRLEDESTDSSDEPNESEPSEHTEDLDSPPPSGKGKKPRAKAQPWVPEEEKALAQAWVDVSENSVRGNAQSGKDFKIRVWKNFCGRMQKVYRSPSQTYSKWRNVNTKVMAFNGIYINIVRAPPSGTNESDWVTTAQNLFKVKTKQTFQHMEFWLVVRNYSKWKALESADDFTGVSTKRSKTSSTTHSGSSDAHTGIDLNAQQYEEPVRHMGRDQAKRKLKGVAGSSSDTNVTEMIGKLDKYDATLQTIAKAKMLREEHRAMEMILRDDSHLDEENRSWLAKAKANIRKKFTFN